jgi:hypothetical protein
VAELVDALDLGSSALACMGVQLPPLAPGKYNIKNCLFHNVELEVIESLKINLFRKKEGI